LGMPLSRVDITESPGVMASPITVG
jgi:hypothetical protein